MDVAHCGGVGQGEEADEADGVRAVAGFGEDPVLPQGAGGQPGAADGVLQECFADGWTGGVKGGLGTDQEVGVGTGGPGVLAVAEPGAQELDGEGVEVEGAARQPEAAVGQVEVKGGSWDERTRNGWYY
ncbi:hypothetical protein [Streptomyces sp. NPDC018000]|uniref:hypothetical protein n=1 Tax=Streptomyces sp. NPDC018000 TaxID=3365028 RepID=UPI00378E14AC